MLFDENEIYSTMEDMAPIMWRTEFMLPKSFNVQKII